MLREAMTTFGRNDDTIDANDTFFDKNDTIDENDTFFKQITQFCHPSVVF